MGVEFYRHGLGKQELAQLEKVLGGSILTTGSYAKEAEELLGCFLNTENSILLDSCTAALHLALVSLGIGEGDEVITTPMTFVATASVIFLTGARPVFVDVEPQTGNIDADKISAAITDKTKAIMPVHLYGHMCDMKAIRKIADLHNLYIIEDAAHCLEGERDGIRPGELGDCACFSFYATKNITCGEGGMLTCRDAALAAKIRRLSCHGIDRTAYARYGKEYAHWDMIDCGWKYNLDNLRASILIPQIPNIDRNLCLREEICSKYEQAFVELGVDHPQTLSGTKNARHLQTVWVDSNRRDSILSKLQQQGIGVAVNYRSLPELTFIKEQGYQAEDYPVAYEIGRRTISLPLYPALTEGDLKTTLEAFKKSVKL
ncbi:DegT/DnrJ/EryC1/StrS family aminotransferase [Maridesulfovibrio sp.]|uniref:DegT/DnrJ/EryC1/StrS family aminotransferase n=1 Tax=Maridesulfovibrio sp. TaxID=2795000 RepID=UPI0029F54A9A|nr:DegT/DnrJ/EryC1/StrS family aminotransferase [Maridesulfovibrio sp.]